MSIPLRHRTSFAISPGRFYPCGATITDTGVNFAIFSEHAQEVYLLLFDSPDTDPTDIIRIDSRTRHIWHVHVEGLRAGQLYGYRIRGEYDPNRGLRFNEYKLLLDPYAKAVTGKFDNADGLLFAYDRTSALQDLVPDIRDNAHAVPKAIVVDDSFDWGGDVPPLIEFEDLIMYEAHLKGFVADSSSGVAEKGMYLGFVEKIPYLKELGVNAVEFLPLQEIYVEDFIRDKGLTNYWGYNTIAFFAPESSYGSGRYPGCQVQEFKTLVRELHKAGIEVIMDVVYNHTGEGNELGPTLSFKGIDNKSYYCLTGPTVSPERYYMNYTGCGNSLKLANSAVLRLVMDSLRYWVQEMHVDGFRFDLASVLGRRANGEFEKSSSFFDAISQDPILCRVKLIAEPWDLHTYQVGNFPVDWSEWNGKFRDTVRRFTRGDFGQIADLGWRLTGSADLYGEDGRSAYNSINFITCHDGFTLNDLVSYNNKHNLANKENNNDGSNDNYSWNCGVEGETSDEDILRLRRKMAKNYLCSLFLSSGTPMLLMGDECLRTQKGNNNAYCQDNEISWFDWTLVEANNDILAFCRKLIEFTKFHRIFPRTRFFQGCAISGDSQYCDITWYGDSLKPPAWNNPRERLLCFQIFEKAKDDRGDAFFFFIFNADVKRRRVLLPTLPDGRKWHRIIDTNEPAGRDFVEEGEERPVATRYDTAGRSVVVLKAR